MIVIYCRGHHGGKLNLCADCLAVWEYAQQRVGRCPFRGDKPACVDCRVHCFKPAKREQIRLVMRYAGPRMVWRHPILSLFHVLDGRRNRPDPSHSR
jgi:predicted amidophosphoribosyltransferase